MNIQEIYQQKCAVVSDINELLPYLKEYGEKVKTITEFGVRQPTSTYAFLAANPEKLVSYDIIKHPDVDLINEPNFEFILGNTLEVEIEETDFLFIDTWHTADQLTAELALHSDKVRKFIGLHDTSSFFHRDEAPYSEQPQQVYGAGPGLSAAIMPFLDKGDWIVSLRLEFNNGLLILERV